MKSHKRLRLGFLRINQETNSLSPVLTTWDDFKRTHFVEGRALLEITKPYKREVEDMFMNVELSGFVRGVRKEAGSDVELVPLFSAWASPSGPLSKECFVGLCERVERSLKEAGPLDGLYICLHGAMNTQVNNDPEAEFLRIAREVVGPDVVIAATFDLHGNLTPAKLEPIDIPLAYKTNPHRDHAAIGAQAGRLLVKTLRGEVKPTVAWRSLPMILGGGTTIDFVPPMRGVFQRMRALEKRDGVLGASTFMCHPWNDHPELGWSVVVVTDGDQALAERLADDLADRCWKVKDRLPPRFSTASEAISDARRARLRRKVGVVTLADVSDVVSAGATGENTKLLKALLEEGRGLVSYVPLRDPVAIEELWNEPVGARVKVTVGGKLDPERNDGLEVEGTIAIKKKAHGLDRVVVLDVGSVRVILVEGPALAIKPSFFTSAGLDPWKADIIVVKNFFPFRLFFLPLSRKTIYVQTGGITDPDAALQLSFAGPVSPKDRVHDWREADARRRQPKKERVAA